MRGELYIGGAQVGRGYLNRDELTADRFLPDLFSQTPGARLYRTGDVARYLPSGAIEYLGRIDFQVKVRGFRIELGEIESVLLQHPAVREAAAAAWEEGPETRLAGYVVLERDAQVSTTELRAHVKERLPTYMVPSGFVVLDALPRMGSGKVDRQGLPDPGRTRGADEAFVAPRTPLEQSLAAIWSQLLRLERVGANDNFFDLGGHSLLATQVVSRVREAFSLELPLRALFEAPTVAELALTLAQAQAEQASPEELARLLEDLEKETPAPQVPPRPL